MKEKVIERWHQRVREDLEVSDVFLDFHKKLFEKGVVYRYSKWRAQKLSSIQKSEIFYPLPFFREEEDFLEFTPLCALRPGFITAQEEQKISRLGKLLHKAIQASSKLLNVPLVQERIGATVTLQKEWEMKDVDPGYEDLSPWMRIDFILKEGEPILVDVNLLPGGTFFQAKLDEVYEDILARYADDPLISRKFSIADLNRVLLKCYQDWKKDSASFPKVTILTRKEHGLTPEMKLWEGYLRQEKIDAKVCYAHEVEKLNNDEVIVRMLRYFSKHVNPKEKEEREQEKKTIELLMQNYKEGKKCVFPPFNLYLEDHQWFWFYQSKEFCDFYKTALGEEDYKWFCAHLPQSWLCEKVGENLLFLDGNKDISFRVDDAKEVIFQSREGYHIGGLASFLKRKVLKRGDSTGAAYVMVLTDPSLKYRLEAISSCLEKPQSVILQELVKPPKEIFPTLDYSGKLIFVSGNLKHSAFFAGGEYIGGEVMSCPTSCKVHGGSETLIVPLYTIYNQ